MWQSLRISRFVLRISLALIFLWSGIYRIFYPDILGQSQSFFHSWDYAAYILGFVELLIGISFLANIFVSSFAFIGIATLIITTSLYDFSEVTRAIGLAGGLLALSLWPDRSFRNY